MGKLIAEINPMSHVAEAFRILRTNLHFLTSEKPLKTLLVTSPGPGEGKSTTSANLAAVMALNEVKVILVDADLRRAEQHHLFDLPNEVGLSNVLAGSMEVNQVLQETRLPNLKVITGGPLPSNPAELLGSERAKELLAELSEMADIVLVDSPPTLVVADALILSSIVDGCLLVIKSAKTKIEDVKHAKERLNKANSYIVGTVLNAVNSNNSSDYYGYYYYGKRERKQLSSGKN